MIVCLSWVIAAAIIGLYIWWFSVRYRREKRTEAEEAERQAPAPSAVFDRVMLAEQPPAHAPADRAPTPAPFEPVAPPVVPAPAPAPAPVAPAAPGGAPAP